MGACLGKGEAEPASSFDGPATGGLAVPTKEKPTKVFARPKWKSETPITVEELQVGQELFWGVRVVLVQRPGTVPRPSRAYHGQCTLPPTLARNAEEAR